ncbi:DUF6292 family protein [Rhodococcus jostii]|uniref:DUF6292 family protein n=1 Tax=Rhodococcus jostii TaxID=132919 RepID=UPI00365FEB61
MNTDSGSAGPSGVYEYVTAVAAAVDSREVRWWDGETFDAVVVLTATIPRYRGRRAVLAFNHYFGWALGAEGLCPETILVIDALGVGRTPTPGSCADQTAELLADLDHRWVRHIPFPSTATTSVPSRPIGNETLDDQVAARVVRVRRVPAPRGHIAP